MNLNELIGVNLNELIGVNELFKKSTNVSLPHVRMEERAVIWYTGTTVPVLLATLGIAAKLVGL